eukprot:scaffold59721_cov37-Tisochrysis_lutea.AAC.1
MDATTLLAMLDHTKQRRHSQAGTADYCEQPGISLCTQTRSFPMITSALRTKCSSLREETYPRTPCSCGALSGGQCTSSCGVPPTHGLPTRLFGPGRRSLAGTNGDAAVDVDAVASDVVGGRVERQILDKARDFLRLAEAANRDRLRDLFNDVSRELVSHVRGNEAGGNGVDGYASRCKFLSHRHCHRDNATLGRRVVSLAGVANFADD